MLVSLLFCNYFKLPSDQHKASLKAKFSKHSHKSVDEKIRQSFAVILLICPQQNFSFIAMILYRKNKTESLRFSFFYQDDRMQFQNLSRHSTS